MPKSEIKVVLGAMTFGEKNVPQANVHDLVDVQSIIDVFKSYGHRDIDTARVYGNGTSEEYLGKLHASQQGLILDTKFYPVLKADPERYNGVIRHTEESLRENLEKSLKALKVDSIETFYLHGPDREIPWEQTLKAVDELHKEGKFERFGVSNYLAWEVSEIVTIAKANGWIQPTVYQGLYNCIHRTVEAELFPCLRKHCISFYLFNPVAGGILVGRYQDASDTDKPNSRFDPNTAQGKNYRARYFDPATFEAVKIIGEAASREGLTLGECALRWLTHHSALRRDAGDAIIVGASSPKHLAENLADLEKGPLPEHVVQAIDQAWKTVKSGDLPLRYWH